MFVTFDMKSTPNVMYLSISLNFEQKYMELCMIVFIPQVNVMIGTWWKIYPIMILYMILF